MAVPEFLTKIENNRYYLSATKDGEPESVGFGATAKSGNESFRRPGVTAVSWIRKGKSIIDQTFLDMIDSRISSNQIIGQAIKDAENKINSSIRLKYK